ncbi:ankyrin repeat-containing domain protein [Baffinella frigidus]|nr:ankyrin repeat-containing domain protein [Cryptophyta sp. CCMP2293]
MVGNVHDGVSTRIPADTPDEHGATALHYAAAAGAVDAAEALLKDGANPNEEDERLTAPLHCATGGVGALLLDYKARVNTRDSAGWTPLHRAAALDDTDFARMLLDYGADIDAVTSTGRTPLHVSALHGAEAVSEMLLAEETVSEMLLAEGADVLAKDADGHRANDLAKFRLLAGLKTAHKVACAGERARRRTVEQAEEGPARRRTVEQAEEGSARDIAARLLKQLQDMSRLERARAGQSAAGARDEDLFTLFNTHDSSGIK